MEKEITKPNIIKGIPVPLIRPLPTLHYFGLYAHKINSNPASKLFKEHVNYLSNAIKILASETSDENFQNISDKTSQLVTAQNNSIAEIVMQITSQLSDLCVKHSSTLKDNPKFSKENLGELYKKFVQPLKVLLIDNNNEPERVNKLFDTFTKTCYFNVLRIHRNAENFIENINKCDFVIFTSAYPITINEDIQNIQTYKKPSLILANLKKDDKFDQQTLRNGAWLEQRGYEVLYKIFTPLRLFTAVDKTYMKY